MNNRLLYIVLFILLAAIEGCLPDPGKRNPARLEDDRLVLTFDLKWNDEKKKEVAIRYDLDSTLMQEVFSMKGITLPDTSLWKIEKIGERFVEVSKSLESEDFSLLRDNDLLLLNDDWLQPDAVEKSLPVKFGVNLLKDDETIEFIDSTVTFRLNDYKDANEVFLAGSFNGWSTMKMPMKREGMTWSITFKLDPGRYTYKYIVDGKWIADPSNQLKEREPGRGTVSVVYMPARIFKLEGRPDAGKVILTGSFLNWSRAGIPMKRSGDNWVMPVYLSKGTWSYKFIVDGEWITDPSNPDTREDASGNLNSFISVGETFLFRLKGFKDAGKAVLAGSFNNWDDNALVMGKDAEGWKLDIALEPGNWEYKFIVDGEWITDPGNPYTTGSGDYTNSLAVLEPGHTFVLKGHADAETVLLTGTFNDWSTSGYRMVREGDAWKLPLHLKPGKCLYKFMVDGEWMLDPANENWEDNEYGTGNSVLWYERP